MLVSPRRLSLCLLLGASTAIAREPSVDGEPFTARKVVDRQQGGIVAYAFRAPEKWKDRSEIFWNFGNINNPATMSVTVENPSSEEAFFFFQPAMFFAFRPDNGFWRDGYVSGGVVKARPAAPLPTLAEFVRRTRETMPRFKVVGSKDLPGLPAALQVNMATNQRGVAVKVTYDLKGKPVEEEFYAVHYSQDLPAGGGLVEIDWGLCAIHSFRAPAGTLDRRREVFAAIPKSFKPNPAYLQRVAAIKQYLAAQWQRNLQQGYDQIAAAGQLSRQISANNDAMIASIDRQMKSAKQATPTGKGRSENDKFDDYIRGVDTVDDPYWGTSQHSSLEKHHWTDGYGSYRSSNAADYDPNRSEASGWTIMPSTK
jgi:hypothetical protein